MKQPQNCPCCGLHDHELPWLNLRGCSACWYYTEIKSTSIASYRQKWISEGMPWRSTTASLPKDWDPAQILARLALKSTKGRVRGRHPKPLP